MTSRPRLSVCVPTYNRAPYLSQALAALRAQTFTEFELLVVDNGSTDGTAALVTSLEDPRLRYHRNERNLSSRQNWNRCLDLAVGDFVAICHDDDLYAPEFLGRAVSVLQAHPRVAFVHTAVRFVDAGGRLLRTFRAYPSDTITPGVEAFLRYLGRSHDVVFSSVVARRACYDAVERFTPEFLCADFEMWLKLALQGDVAYIAAPLVSYRTHTDSTSLTMDPARWHRENCEIVRRAIRWASGKIPGIEAREAELIDRTRQVWARRTLKEALLAASWGQIEMAREYLRVSRDLAGGGSARWVPRLAGILMNPLGVRILHGVRVTRRGLRRVA